MDWCMNTDEMRMHTHNTTPSDVSLLLIVTDVKLEPSLFALLPGVQELEMIKCFGKRTF